MPRVREEEVHLTCDGLARLLAGELGPQERVELVKHLVHGCKRCCLLLGPLAGILPPEQDAPDRGDEDQYEIPVARAIATVRAAAKDLALSRIAVRLDLARILVGSGREEELAGCAEAVREGSPEARWAWCELLIEAAGERRARDVWEAAELADMATVLAEELTTGPFPSEALAELQARAWMELGNLLRVCEDLVGAESALAQARSHLEGIGNPILAARLLDLAGSLYRAQRRFPEALEVLEVAERLYARCGESHLAGRVLVNRGVALIHAAAPEHAIEALERALSLLDFRAEPSMLLAVVHNRLLAMVDAGRTEQAARALWRSRTVYEELGTDLDRVRLLGLEGMIAADQGQGTRAERLFRQARSGFERAGLAYDAALVSLNLAGVLLDQGKSGEVLGLVDEMLETFRELRIAREAVATVLLLRKALRQGEATAALARRIASELRRLSPRPPARRPHDEL